MDHLKMPEWTPEKLKSWAKERHEGHQYNTGYGSVYCPSRESQWEKLDVSRHSR